MITTKLGLLDYPLGFSYGTVPVPPPQGRLPEHDQARQSGISMSFLRRSAVVCAPPTHDVFLVNGCWNVISVCHRSEQYRDSGMNATVSELCTLRLQETGNAGTFALINLVKAGVLLQAASISHSTSLTYAQLLLIRAHWEFRVSRWDSDRLSL